MNKDEKIKFLELQLKTLKADWDTLTNMHNKTMAQLVQYRGMWIKLRNFVEAKTKETILNSRFHSEQILLKMEKLEQGDE